MIPGSSCSPRNSLDPRRIAGNTPVGRWFLPLLVGGVLSTPARLSARELEIAADGFPDPGPTRTGVGEHCIPPSTMTAYVPTEWFCYDEQHYNNLADFAWDTLDVDLGASGLPDEDGSLLLVPNGVIGDQDANAFLYTFLHEPDTGETYTLPAGHVVLVDAWLKSEGLLTNPGLQLAGCPGTDPANPSSSCPFGDETWTSNIYSFRLLDGDRDGWLEDAWTRVAVAVPVADDTPMLRVMLRNDSYWYDVALGPRLWMDSVRVREYPPEEIKYRPFVTRTG